jgi:hypothetical protein
MCAHRNEEQHVDEEQQEHAVVRVLLRQLARSAHAHGCHSAARRERRATLTKQQLLRCARAKVARGQSAARRRCMLQLQARCVRQQNSGGGGTRRQCSSGAGMKGLRALRGGCGRRTQRLHARLARGVRSILKQLARPASR